MKLGNRFGTHRVKSPKGVLPQAAEIIDNSMDIYDNELLIDVLTLNIDSASFTQIKKACNNDLTLIANMIMEIVNTKGKMQNPVTGSGGMLLGTISQIGSSFPTNYQVGDKIATLVSLSLTPLTIEKIKAIHLDNDQVDIVGKAILFESGIMAKMPSDLDPLVALSAFDVAGAPAQVAKLVKTGDHVCVIGAAGKSGLLCCVQARKSVGKSGKVYGIIYDAQQLPDLESLHVCDHILFADATNPLNVYESVLNASKNQKMDVCINCVNVPNTEMASIMITKDFGTVYFFGMATSFQKAALGAEGIASEAYLMIGNGYTSGHGEFTLDLLREFPQLLKIFQTRYGKKELS
ncbi:MAG: L-erythro-3,5-diaminohexanoate dehydrogenase [bacterium]|nr:L-erythro-3,5-diaminohexanoate dehydrogenase [bacterium]